MSLKMLDSLLDIMPSAPEISVCSLVHALTRLHGRRLGRKCFLRSAQVLHSTSTPCVHEIRLAGVLLKVLFLVGSISESNIDLVGREYWRHLDIAPLITGITKFKNLIFCDDKSYTPYS